MKGIALHMTFPQDRRESTLELSLEEQWVVHHVMLDRMELEAQAPTDTCAPPVGVFRIFEKLEAGTHRFTRRERRVLSEELREYVEADGIPERDRPVAGRVLERLREPTADDPAVERAPAGATEERTSRSE